MALEPVACRPCESLIDDGVLEASVEYCRMRPTASCPLGLGTHFGDEDLLSTKMHKEHVGNLVERFIQHPMCGILDNDIELVMNAPNAKHMIRAFILQQCDNTSVSTSHGVFSIRAYQNDFFVPGWRHGVEQNLDELHVILNGMSFEKWNEDEVKVIEQAFHTYANPLIEERNTQMSAYISS